MERPKSNYKNQSFAEYLILQSKRMEFTLLISYQNHNFDN